MNKGLLANRPRLPGWCLAALAIIILATAAAVPTLRHHLVTAPHHQSINTDLQARADRYGALVDAHVEELATLLDRLLRQLEPASALAEARTLLDQGLAEPDPNLRPSLRVTSDPISQWQELAQSRAGGDIELFLVGDDPRTFPLRGNYIAETLHEEALQGQRPPAQAAMVNVWGIYLALPVRDGDTVMGAVILRAPVAPLRDRIVAASDGLDHVELLQQARGGRVGRLLSAGPAVQDTFSATSSTGIPNWRVQVRSTAPLLASIKPPVVAFGAVQLGLWSLALLLCGILLKINLRFQGPAAQPAATRIDPRDDLFTERFIREAPSFLTPVPAPKQGKRTEPPPPPGPQYRYPRQVFRDYDIRGIAGSEITTDFATALGRMLGTLAMEKGDDTLAVAMDGRQSSLELADALCQGIQSSGCDVVRIGMAPSPVLNFALRILPQTRSGVMVTASHNPASHNGFKMVFNNHVLSSAEILDLHERMEAGNWLQGEGECEEASVTEDYLDAVLREIIPPMGLKVVIDCGNGVAGLLAPELFRRLDCEVVELYCEVDGAFPNHPPDPTVAENLATLIDRVVSEQADLGLAFDGDGDRLVAVAASGRIVWPDELLMIFVRDVLTRQPGADVVFDVKCTRRLQNLISSHGGRPVMWKTGHAHLRNKIAESGAPVGGEFSGHLFFNDRWHGFDDGLYAAARLLEIIGFREQGLDDIVASFPRTYATAEIRVAVGDEEKFAFVEALRMAGNFEGGSLISLDGLRVEYPDGWGLIRASNTAPALTLRFEADSEEGLERIKGVFRGQLAKLDQELSLDF